MSGSTLLIDIAGPNTGQFSVLDVLGNATINPNGLLDPVLQNGFVPMVGESFTFMNYSALTGTFFIFDRNIDDTMEHWEVTYQSNVAILTVAPGNVPVPDRGINVSAADIKLARADDVSWIVIAPCSVARHVIEAPIIIPSQPPCFCQRGIMPNCDATAKQY